jgi:phosphatidylglycerol---prolipoprotein diacylglyceryl transferase
MQRTLFFLPHEVMGFPLFGIGLFAAGLAIGFAFWMFRIYRDPGRNVTDELRQNGIVWGIAAIAIVFVLPSVEIRSVDGDPVGVAVRGYGVFLLMGVTAGVALALARAKRAGIAADEIFGLAMWLFVGGIGGARLFYIIEYRSDFWTGDLVGTARKMLDFTRGGLVVYGSIIGGTIAMFAFVYRTWRLRQATEKSAGKSAGKSLGFMGSFLRMGDVVAPCLFLGIFFGRLGCLMNGCCYGGRCEDQSWALHFPPGSPVYTEQLMSGELLGLVIEKRDTSSGTVGRVISVEHGSPADRRGIQVGSLVSQIYLATPPSDEMDRSLPEDDSSQMSVVAEVDARPVIWLARELPDEALAVSPAQVISSISGLLICLLLLFMSWAFWLPNGVLMASGFAVYSLARFGEEMVRTDEPGQFGTSFSISQWISALILPLAVLGIIYIYWKGPAAGVGRSDENSGTGVEN